ncbi:DUF1858 domain-containing protein [Azospirillum doebereinerae]
MIDAPPQPGATLPSSADLVEDVMERWPQTVPVFVKHRMACPGCLMAGFQTVADAAEIYGLDTAALLDAFARAIAGDAPTP